MSSAAREPRLVRIPTRFLHAGSDHLEALGVPPRARGALISLLADLPLVPHAAEGALLVGPAAMTLPCLAALARHVGQGLRDHNAALMHDRARLRAERLKLGFLSLEQLMADLQPLGASLRGEAVLFARDLVWPLPEAAASLFRARREAGLATFATATRIPPDETDWRWVRLEAGA